MELVDISPEVLSGNREEWSEKLRHIVDEDIDKRFILKGVAFTTAFAVCVKFTVVVLTMGGFSQQDTVFCFFLAECWRFYADLCIFLRKP